ncbi:MAG: sigma-70 family RNA polymerase sigma factor [Flavobacteriales bacterium]
MQDQIEQLYKPIFFYIKKRISSREDAEDLTQEVFYKLAKSNQDGIANIKSWIYSIAKNTIIDYYRKKKLPIQEIEDIPFSKEKDEQQAIEELSQCVVSFIKTLPDEDRMLLTLSELENISQKEIAKRLDMNYVTVRSKIQRSRKKLKGVFSDCCTILQGGKGSILDYEQKKNCKGKTSC